MQFIRNLADYEKMLSGVVADETTFVGLDCIPHCRRYSHKTRKMIHSHPFCTTAIEQRQSITIPRCLAKPKNPACIQSLFQLLQQLHPRGISLPVSAGEPDSRYAPGLQTAAWAADSAAVLPSGIAGGRLTPDSHSSS